MNYQVLARKYRPQKFSEVIGQEHVTRTLKNALQQQRIAHGYIFSGHRGIGKTSIARILAMALNCRSEPGPVPEPCGVCESCTEIRAGNSVDVIEIDAATNRGIDEIRELREAARYRPARDRYKIWILDEAHQITDAAFNALLKTLEEPPPHVIFMMATTQPEDIPQTIRSRCQHFSFHAVPFDEILGQLAAIAEREGIQADEAVLGLLAEAGDGSMRDALSIMDQAIACCGTSLTSEMVRELVGAVPSELLEKMLQAVERNSSEDVLRQVDRLLTQGQSPQHFARQMVRFLRNALVAKVAGTESSLLQISADERVRAGRVAEKFSEEDLTRFLQIMLRTHSDLGYKQEQRFHLELGLLKLVHAGRLLPLEQWMSDTQLPGGSQPAGGPSQARASSGGGSSARPAERPPARAGSASLSSTPARPSPFESDLARKRQTPENLRPENLKDAPGGQPEQARGATLVLPETVVPEIAASEIAASPSEAGSPASSLAVSVENLRESVLAAVSDSTGLLAEGEWELHDGELLVTLAVSEKILPTVLDSEAKRRAGQAASAAAGHPIRFRALGGGTPERGRAPVSPAKASGTPGGPNGTAARARASQEPVVRRMQEKFGAEIRTVIDYKEKH